MTAQVMMSSWQVSASSRRLRGTSVRSEEEFVEVIQLIQRKSGVVNEVPAFRVVNFWKSGVDLVAPFSDEFLRF